MSSLDVYAFKYYSKFILLSAAEKGVFTMPEIKWVGMKDADAAFPEQSLPYGAKPLRTPDPFSAATLPYGLLPLLLCFGALFFKAWLLGRFPMEPGYIPLGILLGLLLIPVHEYLHGVCYPKGSTVYVGLIPKKMAAFAVCHVPISWRRFMVMSLLPAILGLVPLLAFLFAPASWGKIMGVCWPLAVMGLLSPMPDYMCVACVRRQVPRGAWLQTTNSGCFWYM